MGVSRQSVHTWIGRYLAEGLPGLADRSHRPGSCPHQVAAEAEVAVAEMRRQHPKWGAKRIRLELLRRPPEGMALPSERTINRIFARQGLVVPRPRKRPRDSYRRWQRPGPMQLWQIDIVGGVMIADTRSGELREAKVVTGVDDHSRFCVIAAVAERATGRAVCLALAVHNRRSPCALTWDFVCAPSATRTRDLLLRRSFRRRPYLPRSRSGPMTLVREWP